MAVVALQKWAPEMVAMGVEERIKSVLLGDLMMLLMLTANNKHDLEQAIEVELEVEAQSAYGEWS